MRDGQILAMQQVNAKRDGLILSQFEFLKTRQEAFETVILGSSALEKLLWVVRPQRLLRRVDAVQRRYLEQAREDLEQARAKAKIQPAPDLGRGLRAVGA